MSTSEVSRQAATIRSLKTEVDTLQDQIRGLQDRSVLICIHSSWDKSVVLFAVSSSSDSVFRFLRQGICCAQHFVSDFKEVSWSYQCFQFWWQVICCLKQNLISRESVRGFHWTIMRSTQWSEKRGGGGLWCGVDSHGCRLKVTSKLPADETAKLKRLGKMHSPIKTKTWRWSGQQLQCFRSPPGREESNISKLDLKVQYHFQGSDGVLLKKNTPKKHCLLAGLITWNETTTRSATWWRVSVSSWRQPKMLARPTTMPWCGVGVVAAPLVFVVVVSSVFVLLCLSVFCTTLSLSVFLFVSVLCGNFHV